MSRSTDVLLSGREEHVMATTIAPTKALSRWAGHTTVQRGVSSRRRSVADALEITLDPQLARRRALLFWPRIPRVNRAAVAEPLQEMVELLRDPAIEVPEENLRRVLALATHPASPLYGPYVNRARFAAWALADELRASADSVFA
jgi:hypothetical protein